MAKSGSLKQKHATAATSAATNMRHRRERNSSRCSQKVTAWRIPVFPDYPETPVYYLLLHSCRP